MKLAVGSRVRFSRDFLKGVGVGPTDPMWRAHGTIVGYFPPKHVRVLFDGEAHPRAVAEASLARV